MESQATAEEGEASGRLSGFKKGDRSQAELSGIASAGEGR